MRDHFVERQLLADAQLQRELPVEVAGLDAQQRGGHRQDRDRRALRGQAPQPDGALLADFGVRREVLQRQNVERGKQLRAGAVVRHQQVEEGLLIASESASACLLPSTTMIRGRPAACHSSTE